MAFGDIRTRGKGKALRRFVHWCISTFISYLDVPSQEEVRGLIANWDITVRVLPRRTKLWERSAVLPDGRRTRGVAVLPAPAHWKYQKRRLGITLEPQLLLDPPSLAYILMHEVGHALRYAEFQRLGKEMGLPEGMMLKHEENEADAEQTAQMFVQRVGDLAWKAQNRQGRVDPRLYISEKFCSLVSADPVTRAMIARVAREFGVTGREGC